MAPQTEAVFLLGGNVGKSPADPDRGVPFHLRQAGFLNPAIHISSGIGFGIGRDDDILGSAKSRNLHNLHRVVNACPCGHILAKQVIQLAVEDLTQIHQLVQLRVGFSGFPFGNSLPGNTDLFRQLFLGHTAGFPPQILKIASKKHQNPSFLIIYS